MTFQALSLQIVLDRSSSSAATLTSTEQVNTFITQAEQRIYNTIQFPSLRANVTGTLTANNKYLACPADFLAVYSMAVINADTSYTYLLNKDVNFIREAYPTPTDTGTPAYYALFGPVSTNEAELTFILGPTLLMQHTRWNCTTSTTRKASPQPLQALHGLATILTSVLALRFLGRGLHLYEG
jgi:hypothetical protein